MWLSPGSTVELVEIHTRPTTVEKTLETTLDILTSRRHKDRAGRDLRCGQGGQRPEHQVRGERHRVVRLNLCHDQLRLLDLAEGRARNRHKQLRQQTEKLSSEIRKNYKSTFKTTTETTDITSVKHTMANTTQELINYELRRKMRQVGVQVQDIGTFLCWQTYVDDPGEELGLAKLIHIAKPADLDAFPHPEEIPLFQPFQEDTDGDDSVHFRMNGADNEGEVYEDGVESDDSEFMGSLEKIQSDFPQEFVCPKANYVLTSVEFDPQGKPITASIKGGISNSDSRAAFTLHLDSADFGGQNSVQLKLTLHWSPSSGANDEAIQKNKDNLAAFKARESGIREGDDRDRQGTR